MRASKERGSPAPSLRGEAVLPLSGQARGIEALLAVVEWGTIDRASAALGVRRQALKWRLGSLYRLLDVRDQTQATLMVWPLIRDAIVIRDRMGEVVSGRRRSDRAA